MSNQIFYISSEMHWVSPYHNLLPSMSSPFRALAKFTSNFEPSFTALITLGGKCSDVYEIYNADLTFAFASSDEIQTLLMNSEIVILNGFRVIAVCRSLKGNFHPGS